MRTQILLVVAVSVAFTLFAPMSASADETADEATAKRVFLEKMGQGRFDRLEDLLNRMDQ